MATLSPKYDHGLANLLKNSFAPSEEIPVIVVAADGRYAEVSALVRRIGKIRQELEYLNSVSAWLKASDIKCLVNSDAVEALELVRASVLAID